MSTIQKNLAPFGELMDTALRLINDYLDAKEYGSILNIRLTLDEIESIEKKIEEIKKRRSEDVELYMAEATILNDFPPLLAQARIMIQKYDVVVTNPPYMNTSYMPDRLKAFVQKNYPEFKDDLFAAFTKKTIDMVNDNGHIGLLTPYVWMFITSYKEMRNYVNNTVNITSMVQLEYNAFEAACVPVVTFTFCKSHIHSFGSYIRLSDFKGAENQPIKTLEAISNPKSSYRYTCSQDLFRNIPGSPVAYWVTDRFVDTFNCKKLGEYASTNNGFTTGDNNKFLRLWNEVSFSKICFNNESVRCIPNYKWFPYNKGGDARKWYGNNDYIINWGNDGYDMKNYGHLVPRSLQYQFKPSGTWNKITSSSTTFRFKESGSMFDVGGLSMFVDSKETLLYLIGLCNSVYAKKCLEIISPTLNCETGHVASIPVIFEQEHDVVNTVTNNICISKKDWDSFETSWNFKKHPLI